MNTTSDSPANAVDDLAHTRTADCYQCGKCSAGCPMAGRMDVLPNQLVGLVQTGRIDKAIRAEAIWLCVSCCTCSTRCPKSVDCAGVIDALKQIADQQGVASPAQHRTITFQRAFLDNVRRNGRLNEVELIGEFKTRAFLRDLNIPLLLKDAGLAPKLFARGKFHLLGEKAKDRGIVRRIFERCAVQNSKANGKAEANGKAHAHH